MNDDVTKTTNNKSTQRILITAITTVNIIIGNICDANTCYSFELSKWKLMCCCTVLKDIENDDLNRDFKSVRISTLNAILIRYRKHNVKITKKQEAVVRFFWWYKMFWYFPCFWYTLMLVVICFVFFLNAKHVVTLLSYFYHDITYCAEIKHLMMCIFVIITMSAAIFLVLFMSW